LLDKFSSFGFILIFKFIKFSSNLMTPFLEIRKLSKNFGGLLALDTVSFEVNRNEVLGLIGPNGAGKTTLFNTISGIFKPSSGSIFFNGEDITGLKPHLVAAKGIIRTFQATVLFHNLSVMENVIIGCHLWSRSGVLRDLISGLKLQKKEDTYYIGVAFELMESLGLISFKDELAGNLPHGYQRLVGIAVALASNPKVLLLDEPVTGMNPIETKETVDHIRRLAQERGLSVIIVEHDMKAIMSVCERIVALNFGLKIAEGPPEIIMNSKEVIEAYLGAEYGRI